jgi:hypothetical protein
VLAMESDIGNFIPTGFGFTGLPEAQEYIKIIGNILLSQIGAGNITVILKIKINKKNK